MSERTPCTKCGRILHTGQGRVLVSFSTDELVSLVNDTLDLGLRGRLLCALSLLDPIRAAELS